MSVTGLLRMRTTAAAAAVLVGACATLASADDMSTSQQNALVGKYCAVCHTDAANNGGLSLEHYDASRVDPPLAAMLLSKLRNGAMGAAGLGVPDKETQAAWVAATRAQASAAESWTVIRSEALGSRRSTLTASIVRRVLPRKPDADAPVYRLVVACESMSGQGTIQLAWSPEPQTNRTFLVSADGHASVTRTVTGQEKMGNGTASMAGRAAVTLGVPLPKLSLTIADLFPAESVVFPLDALDRDTSRQLAVCFPEAAEAH